MNKIILNCKELNVLINETKIINNLSLKIKQNEIHIIMGPNGSGKSTLLKALTGHPGYLINAKLLKFLNSNLLCLSAEDRFHLGIFLAFQYPLEIQGVTNYDFLQLAYNEHQKFLKKNELNPIEILSLINNCLPKLNMPSGFLKRDLNVGFSGGEKKQNEILQMLLLKPKLILLDELDSGLDLDAIKLIYSDILKNRLPGQSLLVVTHSSLIANYLEPDYIHILKKGEIVKTGNSKILLSLKENGYENF